MTYDDVAGMRNVKKELQEIVAYLKDPSKFKKLGGELPKGMLLVGPPGVGKTLLAQATAGEANVPILKIKIRRREWCHLNSTFNSKSPKGQTNGI